MPASPYSPGQDSAGPDSPSPEEPAAIAPAGPAAASRYVMPTTPASRVTTSMFNSTVAWLTRRGVSIWGSRVLYMRGRTSGELRSNPVNVLTVSGDRYLVAPRGNTQWVRNLRAAGEGELRVGRHAERFTATELADDQKPDILRAYLKRWRFEVGVFFDGVGPDAPDAKLREIAPGYPVFLLARAAG